MGIFRFLPRTIFLPVKISSLSAFFLLFLFLLPAHAVIIGTDDFDGNPTSHSGWNWNSTDLRHSGASAGWDRTLTLSGDTDKQLVTQNHTYFHPYHPAPATGITNANDPVRIFSCDLTIVSTNSDWLGFSFFNGGTELAFFGKLGGGTEDEFCILKYGPTSPENTRTGKREDPIIVGTPYRLIGIWDAEEKTASMWIYDLSESEFPEYTDWSAPTLTLDMTGIKEDWTNQIRIASGGGSQCSWDNLIIANDIFDIFHHELDGFEPIPRVEVTFDAYTSGEAIHGKPFNAPGLRPDKSWKETGTPNRGQIVSGSLMYPGWKDDDDGTKLHIPGDSGAGGCVADDVCLAGRSEQLHHGVGLPRQRH